jgi:hypothetical protein
LLLLLPLLLPLAFTSGWPGDDSHSSAGIPPSGHSYDLRKLKAHALLERDGRRYAYRLTDKGSRVALMFVLFHQRMCGPLANSLSIARPPNSMLPPASSKRLSIKPMRLFNMPSIYLPLEFLRDKFSDLRFKSLERTQ